MIILRFNFLLAFVAFSSPLSLQIYWFARHQAVRSLWLDKMKKGASMTQAIRSTWGECQGIWMWACKTVRTSMRTD